MRQKNDTEVLIGGTRYTISGYESAEYIMKIATYINDKLSVIKKNTDPRLLDNDIKNILLQINIADDYHKQVARTQAVTEEKNDADKALFELKHEMMKLTEQVEKLTVRNKQLKEEVSAEKKKQVQSADMLEEAGKKSAEIHELLEEERKKNTGLQEQLEEEIKKTAETQEQLEEERKKNTGLQEQLEEEIKKTAETQKQLEKEKADYEELEKTIDDLLGSAE